MAVTIDRDDCDESFESRQLKAELDEVSIGLAVSIDGSIGIASAGAEASIELTYKIKY